MMIHYFVAWLAIGLGALTVLFGAVGWGVAGAAIGFAGLWLEREYRP